MERRQLEFFVAVIEYRGFTRAAAALHVSQPSLSRAIKLLEDELGTRLFKRTPSGIIVTDAAEVLMRRARSILHEFDAFRNAARAAATDLAGTVEVGLTAGAAMEPMTSIVAALQKHAPRIRTIGVAQPSSEAALAAVTNGDVQVALFGHPGRPLSAEHITFDKVFDEEIMLALPPGSALAEVSRVRPSELSGQAFIVTPAGTVLRQKFEELARAADGLRIAAEVGHREVVVPMVIRGIGLGLLPSSWQPFVRAGGGSLRGFSPPAHITTWLASRPRQDPATRVFIDTALSLVRPPGSAGS